MKKLTPIRWIVVLSGFCVLFLGLLHPQHFSSAAVQERQYEVAPYKDLPVAVQEVKNLKADEATWLRDLQVVVKNVSDKPIYFIAMNVEFPDMTPPGGGSSVGFCLFYGRPELGDIKVPAGPADVPIQPGATHTFTIPSVRAKSYESMKKRKGIVVTKRVLFSFAAISFGDQTGLSDGLSGLLDFRARA